MAWGIGTGCLEELWTLYLHKISRKSNLFPGVTVPLLWGRRWIELSLLALFMLHKPLYFLYLQAISVLGACNSAVTLIYTSWGIGTGHDSCSHAISSSAASYWWWPSSECSSRSQREGQVRCFFTVQRFCCKVLSTAGARVREGRGWLWKPKTADVIISWSY